MARAAVLTIAGAAVVFALCMIGVLISGNTAQNEPEITVERQSNTASDTADAHPDEPPLLININTASAAELELLDGIGPALAERIVEYREVCGGFIHTEQLMDVSGIGESVYKGIANHITLK